MTSTPYTPPATASKRKIVDEEKSDEEEPLFPRGKNPRTPEYPPPAPPTPTQTPRTTAKRARHAPHKVYEYDASTGLDVLVNAHPKLHVDIVAIVLSTGDLSYTRNRIPYLTVTICDPTLKKTSFTLWGDKSAIFRFEVGDIIKIQSARVKVYDGMLQINSTKSTQVKADAGNRRCEYLRTWWEQNRDTHFVQVYRTGMIKVVTLSEAHESVIRQKQGTGYFFVKARLRSVDNDVTYQACPECGTKVIRFDSGGWFCNKCRADVEMPCHKYLLHLEAIEGSVVLRLTGFDAAGREIFGMSAEKLLEHDVSFYYFWFVFRKSLLLNRFCSTQSTNETRCTDAISAIGNFRYTIRCSGTIETYKDENVINFRICDVLTKEKISREERDRLDIDEEVGSTELCEGSTPESNEDDEGDGEDDRED